MQKNWDVKNDFLSNNQIKFYFMDENGLKQGPYSIIDMSNNNRIETGFYKDGELDGIITYYRDGIKDITKNYKNGKWVDNITTKWHENGNISAIELYNKVYVEPDYYDKDDDAYKYVPNGAWTEFYENGNIKSEVHYENGNQYGRCKYWFQNGNLHKIVNLKKDPHLTECEFTEWHKGGFQKKEQGTFLNDKKVGIWTTWYPNGIKSTETNHSNYSEEIKYFYLTGELGCIYKDFKNTHFDKSGREIDMLTYNHISKKDESDMQDRLINYKKMKFVKDSEPKRGALAKKIREIRSSDEYQKLIFVKNISAAHNLIMKNIK